MASIDSLKLPRLAAFLPPPGEVPAPSDAPKKSHDTGSGTFLGGYSRLPRVPSVYLVGLLLGMKVRFKSWAVGIRTDKHIPHSDQSLLKLAGILILAKAS